MKNFKRFAICRTSMISLISIAVILFSVSSIETAQENVAFEVLESKIFISGSKNAHKWKLESNTVACQGNFELKNEELLNVSDLSFLLPVDQLKSNNQQLESTIQEVFKQNNCSEITFRQKYIMILPIMKMMHIIGELSMANGNHAIPMQVRYELDDQTLKIKGKQLVSLSEFGIKLPEYVTEIMSDQVELEIELTLIKRDI